MNEPKAEPQAKAARTPGAWYQESLGSAYVMTCLGSRIADCRQTNSPDENIENARLIASAPELLAACQFILAILEHPTKSVSDFDADKLRAAISKATGEQP